MAKKQPSIAKRQDSNDVPVSDEIARAAQRLGFVPGRFEDSEHAEAWLSDVLVRATDKTSEMLASLELPCESTLAGLKNFL
jgi:hypothetical protein